ncbi:MAG: chorismate mutase [Firmicutes bacterium]|nr:chorismate mutase [Bacillota bacterium]
METVKAFRGATTTRANTREEILAATRELLTELIGRNKINPQRVISVFFTATPDLDAAFPAEAARQLGYNDWALLDSVEMAVPGSLPRCIRVLLHAYHGEDSQEVYHVYLRAAKALRPDWDSDDD